MAEYPTPGFRFYPTEEELISFYLHNKLDGSKYREELNRVIPVVDVYQFEPWQLPEVSGELCHGDTEQWFFFVPRQQREAQGGRPNRTTGSGYWKATGSPSYVYSSNNREIGLKKTMVFYKGKAPTGRKTKWKMNEYRAIEEEMDNPHSFAVPKLRHEFSVCRVYVVSGSVRAFDRRPLGTETREKSVMSCEESNGNGVASCSQNPVLKCEKTSLSESSYSGEEMVDHLAAENVITGYWEMVDGLEEPHWEWDQRCFLENYTNP